ncbi:hypothetical protein DMB38_20265 [Streptomyces sp. WAC 06738]|uniref:hypothetical protein n=1 Tax=Streptomyces sp. WAC 06738 TaxID=2203210 RepID=UPI000F707F40|nr:hypothetical protein [Streptomyces sp. WAC 06738]AZM47811.1 hypothetical protein DMB38_20265 [Streptomyces sp. WAC 06738]
MVKFWNLSAWKNPLDRGDHTGTQTASTISDLATTVQGYRLDQFAAPTAAVNVNGQRVTNGATPTASSDLATKSYVDNARAGIAGVKDPVRVVATANVNLSSLPAALDGVTLAANDSFLATAQTTGTENGIYTYSASGGAATRRTDADSTGEILDGTLVAVSEGTTKAGAQYMQTATPSGAPGAWTQTWVQYSSGGQTYTADGQGIELSGTTFSIELADATLSKSASGLTVGLVSIAKGGTGATDAAGARTALGTVGKYSANVAALTGGSALNITHSLGTTDILEPSLKEISTGELVGAKFVVVDANTVSVTTSASYAADTFRVTVVG